MPEPHHPAGRLRGCSRSSRFLLNPQRLDGPYPPALRAGVSAQHAAQAMRVMASVPGYQATPLVDLPDVAGMLRVASVCYKDEGRRFAEAGLKSFKALGALHALYQLLARRVQQHTRHRPTPRDLLLGAFAQLTQATTVCCATDGNYGRAVAWAARLFGCRAVIFVAAPVSQRRVDAIAAYGTTVRRAGQVYEDAVAAAEAEARRSGWDVLSDTAYPGCEELPRLVTQGYTAMLQEASAQWLQAPSHVFVQCGVGGLAASVIGYLWDRFPDHRPVVVVVEPHAADCAFESARTGALAPASGDLDTVCAGLACGRLSTLAWAVLAPGADAFMTIPDPAVVAAMRFLGRRPAPVVAGESAPVGLAAAAIAATRPTWRHALKLDHRSRILTFGTEADTDPQLYRALMDGPETPEGSLH